MSFSQHLCHTFFSLSHTYTFFNYLSLSPFSHTHIFFSFSRSSLCLSLHFTFFLYHTCTHFLFLSHTFSLSHTHIRVKKLFEFSSQATRVSSHPSTRSCRARRMALARNKIPGSVSHPDIVTQMIKYAIGTYLNCVSTIEMSLLDQAIKIFDAFAFLIVKKGKKRWSFLCPD